MTPYLDLYFVVLCGVPIAWMGDTATRRGLQKLYFVFLWIVLSVFAGSRSLSVDRDLQTYFEWFQAIATNQATAAEWLRDPSFGVISYSLFHLGLGFRAVVLTYDLLAVGALMAVAVFGVAERWSTLAFYLLFCQYYAVAEMTELRSAVAIPLMTLSILAACRKRWRLSAVLLLVAIFFHFSAILALPVCIFLLAGIQFRSRLYIVFLVGAAIVAYIELSPLLALLSNLYRLSEYLNGGEEQNDLKAISWYALLHLIPIAIAVYSWKKLSLQIRVAALLSSFAMACFFMLSWNTGLATRLLYLFDLFWIVLWVYDLDRIEGARTYLYTFLMIALGLALYVKSLQYLSPYSIIQI
ncbi:MAG TPA: EpsG family protein [Terracidiphilus sp.]|nr:EpsG family protein [Terracidiphilus sp.]